MITLEEIIAHLFLIPDERWIMYSLGDNDSARCAVGHINFLLTRNVYNSSHTKYLLAEFGTTIGMLENVNDGVHGSYEQTTPKQRSIAFLKSI